METRIDRGGWRGGRVSRLEALTDTVFGFAITLLVVSLEVPGTFDDLLMTMRGFVAFACSFALLILVWWYHYRLFGRYRMDDGYVVFLNSALLFVVLFYVYPLKFVFTAWLGPEGEPMFTAEGQVRLMMIVYALGFIAVFGVFTLLFRHAIALREKLGLGDAEVLAAREEVGECLVMMGVGTLSIGVAALAPAQWAAPGAGTVYFLIGPTQFLVGQHYGRQRQALLERSPVVTASGRGGGSHPPVLD